ncbi:MAG: LTA synthase family protein, partial [Enterococcus viikkiensis]
GLEILGGDPLQAYREVADQTYSGQMLSQNYGGGTANIEFEALTGFSMELFNAQMSTPYTMLVPKFDHFPSLVSTLEKRGYQTTAIHPYNTSMYKRKDVYQTFGFDQFLDEETMKYQAKIEDNPYISDEAAYNEVYDHLTNQKKPQFLHLVTMQTHMPYENKYSELPYLARGENTTALRNYMQDIAYSSQALQAFLKKIDDLPERTLVVFWGDHLPGIYSDEIQAKNQGPRLHETEFLMYDNRHQLNNQRAVTSPFYFGADLFQQGRLQMTGFQELLVHLQKELPAFEKGMYSQAGNWNKEVKLNQKQEKIYQDYQMIQYDITTGKQYSLKENFFD